MNRQRNALTMGTAWPLVCRYCRKQWWTWEGHTTCERQCAGIWNRAEAEADAIDPMADWVDSLAGQPSISTDAAVKAASDALIRSALGCLGKSSS